MTSLPSASLPSMLLLYAPHAGAVEKHFQQLTWYGSASTTFDVMGRAERSSSGIFVSFLKWRRVHSCQM